MPGAGTGASDALRDADAASQIYDRLLLFSELDPTIARAAYCLGSTEHYLGRLALAADRPGVARAHLERAIERNSAIAAEPRVARGRALLARARSRAGA